MRDYQLVSPSLDGVLNDESITYDGIKRPLALLRILDGPASKGKRKDDDSEDDVDEFTVSPERDTRVLEEYFNDLYGVFMKRLSHFIVDATAEYGDTVKLQAMLQEMIKVKRLMGKS